MQQRETNIKRLWQIRYHKHVSHNRLAGKLSYLLIFHKSGTYDLTNDDNIKFRLISHFYKKPTMAKFMTAVEHQLDSATAQSRLQDFITQMTIKQNDSIDSMEGTWNGNNLTFELTVMGMKVSGTLTVSDDVIEIQGTMPFALSLMRGRMEKTMEQELRNLLA